MKVKRKVTQVLRKIGVVIRVAVLAAGIWDSNPVPRDWSHITKVDPEEQKRLPLLYPLYLGHTDAVSVGGSSNVTATNTEETFELLGAVSSPVFHEPSEAQHVTEQTQEQATFTAIPEVLNGDTRAMIGMLGEGITYLYDDMIPDLLKKKAPGAVDRYFHDFLITFATSWFLERAVFEAYIIQNPDSAAADRSGVTSEDLLSPSEARERAAVADLHLDSEVVYLEYSGTYGGEEAVDIINEIKPDLRRARIWYGGGIDDRKKAAKVLDAGADTVIVGDIFHDIAAEEARLRSQAADTFEKHPTPDEVRAWLSDVVEVESTLAVDYLRTIPEVANPERTGKEYLTLTLGLALLVGETPQTDSPTADEGSIAATEIDELALPTEWEELLNDAFAGGGIGSREYLGETVAPLVDNSIDASVPVHHLSVAEPKSTESDDPRNESGKEGRESDT